MKFFHALSYLSLLSIPSQTFANPSSLRGRSDQDLKGPFSNLKCTLEARGDEETCNISTTDEGEPCSYCSMSSDGQEAGLCVNPEVAQQMMQLNPSITCTKTHLEEGTNDHDADVIAPSVDDFKCTYTALNDPEECMKTQTRENGEWCDYCTMDGPLGPQGVCVSPEHADALKKLAPEFVTCQSHDEIKAVEKDDVVKSNPITDCNLSGTDHETCLDPSKVNGSECVWCDAGIGGFCFPKSWEDKMSHFFECGDQATEKKDEGDEEGHNKLHINPSFFGSSCFKIGLTGATPDDCRESLDDATGEHCVFCNSPKLGGIGLCMPPDFKGNEGSFYTCDGDLKAPRLEIA